MNKSLKLCTLSSSLVLLGSMAAVAPAAYGQQATPQVEEVVVTGSRGAPRSALDSPAPIDVIGASDFREQGTNDINDLLRNLVPSFNVEARDISDTQSLVRPNQLRGLPADNTLILVNNKRRHRSAAIQYGNTGTHFPDTSTIPPIALQQVEVLRDGASAQYGSDAIAGVFNFLLKENSEGLSLEYRTGLYTNSSDGETHFLAGNVGLPLGDRGFLSLSFDTLNQQPTNRAVQRGDAQGIIDRGNIAVLDSSLTTDTVMRQGLPKVDAFNGFFNAGIELDTDLEFYSFGGYGEKTTDLGFFFRNPENRNGVFTRGNNQLIFDVTPDGTGDCPVIPSTQRTGVGSPHGTSSLAAMTESRNNPNCFSFAEWWPGGYTPQFGADMTDVSNTTGFRGELDDGTSYDLSVGLGYSSVDYFLYNTTNPSMGPESPTSFRPGVYTTIENTVGLDLVKQVDIDGFASPLYVAYGIEWRREIFKTDNYDEDSWRAGPYANTYGAGVGSDGFQGFSPQQQGSWDRKNWGFYVDLESDVTDRLLLGAALRYEDFYDSFGDTTNGKLSARYRLTDTTNLRGTISTGFRAPSPGQSNISNLATGVDNNIPVAQGQIPPTNPISVRFGGQVLTPEKSKNLSMGFATQVGPVDLTVDYYHIEMEDRILNSSFFQITPQIAQELQESGIAGAASLTRIRYYTNDMDTTNKGIEVVASYTQNWDNGSSTTFNGSWAWTDQEIDDFTPGLLSRAAALDLTDTIPSNRGNFRATHLMGDLRITGQANYYDNYLNVPSSADPSRDYWVASAVIFSAEVGYSFLDNYSVVIGADNLFDRMPPRVRPIDFGSTSSNQYLTGTAYSPNGRYLYARIQYDM